MRGPDRDIPALTSLRMLAALLVFLFHFRPVHPRVLVDVATEGHVGVTVFFVLSGFLIALRYSGRFSGAGARPSLRDYFARRVARIVPLYWVVLGLSLFFSGARLLSWQTLPEWMLLQGLLGRSLRHLAVPTAWSLTVEECFYASAPLLFLALGALRRRFPARPAAATLAGLGAWVALLAAAGALLAAAVPASGPGFVATLPEVLTHTIFGRAFDFAVGMAAAYAFGTGAVAAWWSRRGGTAVATALFATSLALGYAAQRGMTAGGGIEAAEWTGAWRFNPLIALASAGVILSLTCARAPHTRALSWTPFVYMGRVSYALYLIQMTPLGKGVLYRLLPTDSPLSLPLLYAGMTAVAALLFELVEEPAREALLRVWGRAPAARVATSRLTARTRAAALAVLAATVAAQLGTWSSTAVDRRLGPPTQQEAVTAALDPQGVLTVPRSTLRERDDGARLVLPTTWREGWREDARAPARLLVYADGATVPFLRQPEGEPEGTVAWIDGPRARSLSLRVPPGVQAVTVVHQSPAVAGALAAARLVREPAPLLLTVALLAGALVAGAWVLRRRDAVPLRAWCTLGVAAVIGWIAFDVDELAWAPALVALELAALAVFTPPTTTAGAATRAARASAP